MVYGIRRFVYNTFFFLILLCAAGLAYRHLFHGRIVPLVIAAVLLAAAAIYYIGYALRKRNT